LTGSTPALPKTP